MLPSIAPKGDTLRNLVDGTKKFLVKNTLSGGDTNLNSSCLTIYNQGGQEIVPADVISSARLRPGYFTLFSMAACG